MNAINVIVYYNTIRSVLLEGYKQGDLLEKVWEGITFETDVPKILIQVFNYLNGEQSPFGNPPKSVPRSMSVGDVVILQNVQNGLQEVHVCANFGWDQIYPEVPKILYTPPNREDFRDEEIKRIREIINGVNVDSFGGGKIQAIRYVRSVHVARGMNYSLQEAKKFVESIQSE